MPHSTLSHVHQALPFAPKTVERNHQISPSLLRVRYVVLNLGQYACWAMSTRAYDKDHSEYQAVKARIAQRRQQAEQDAGAKHRHTGHSSDNMPTPIMTHSSATASLALHIAGGQNSPHRQTKHLPAVPAHGSNTSTPRSSSSAAARSPRRQNRQVSEGTEGEKKAVPAPEVGEGKNVGQTSAAEPPFSLPASQSQPHPQVQHSGQFPTPPLHLPSPSFTSTVEPTSIRPSGSSSHGYSSTHSQASTAARFGDKSSHHSGNITTSHYNSDSSPPQSPSYSTSSSHAPHPPIEATHHTSQAPLAAPISVAMLHPPPHPPQTHPHAKAPTLLPSPNFPALKPSAPKSHHTTRTPFYTQSQQPPSNPPQTRPAQDLHNSPIEASSNTMGVMTLGPGNRHSSSGYAFVSRPEQQRNTVQAQTGRHQQKDGGQASSPEEAAEGVSEFY